MTLKIEDAIEEIERALAGNKPKYANDIYLNNAIRYLQEIKSPSLTDDQQVVLEWLKEETQKTDDCSFAVIHRFFTEKLHKRLHKDVYFSYLRLNDEQQFQVLAAFAEWGLKGEER